MVKRFRAGRRAARILLGALTLTLVSAPTLFAQQGGGGSTPLPFDQLDANGYPVACYVDVAPEGVSDVRQMAQCVYEWRVSVGSQPVMGANGPIEYGLGIRVAHNVAISDETKLFFGVIVGLAFFLGMRLAKTG